MCLRAYLKPYMGIFKAYCSNHSLPECLRVAKTSRVSQFSNFRLNLHHVLALIICIENHSIAVSSTLIFCLPSVLKFCFYCLNQTADPTWGLAVWSVAKIRPVSANFRVFSRHFGLFCIYKLKPYNNHFLSLWVLLFNKIIFEAIRVFWRLILLYNQTLPEGSQWSKN